MSLMFLPHFDVLCDLLLNRRTATWNLFVLYNKRKAFLIQHNAKAGLAPPLPKDGKKPFDVIYDLYKMEQFHWFLCVEDITSQTFLATKKQTWDPVEIIDF